MEIPRMTEIKQDRQDEPLEGIAVIGMAGRFPGAADLEAFWRNLRDGVEGIRFFSEEELLAAGVDPALLGDPRYVRAAGTLERAEWFDAGFFGFTPREAEIMDPQHRLFLETTWAALEHAGYVPDTFEGVIGLFGGMSLGTYLHWSIWPSCRPTSARRAWSDCCARRPTGPSTWRTTRRSGSACCAWARPSTSLP
jgi:acyl transferase domain-containing protein